MIYNEIIQWVVIIIGLILLFKYKRRTDWIRIRENEKSSILKWFG